MDTTLNAQRKILITGAAGFIGRAIVERLAGDGADVIGVDQSILAGEASRGAAWETADITDADRMKRIFDIHQPDVVVHAAGIAHQKMGGPDFDTYIKVNSTATRNLAEFAFQANPGGRFIFLSSISVYGEKGLPVPCGEDAPVRPTSDYGRSKAEAEKGLMRMAAKKDFTGGMDILRLAPVYDRDWRLNLERRVVLPGRIGYVRFGAGEQRMSILARPNLVDFVRHLAMDRNRRGLAVMNVCDRDPARFIDLIRVFRKARVYPFRPVVPVPAGFVRLMCRIMGGMIPSRREWFDAAWDKLSADLVFDNTRMLRTGFEPRQTVYSMFD